MMRKYKKIVVTDSTGKERVFQFQPGIISNSDEDFICDSVCPYGLDFCSVLPHPEFPEDDTKTFQDFCFSADRLIKEKEHSSADEDSSDLGVSYVPVCGTIEENLPEDNPDVARLVRKNKLVKLTQVIDAICPDVCGQYSEDYSRCTYQNRGCILHELLKNINLKRDGSDQ